MIETMREVSVVSGPTKSTKRSVNLMLAGLLALALLGAAACGEDDQTGTEGHACHADGSCNGSLICVDGTCVPPDCDSDCSELDGWYDVDSPYACCVDDELCDCLEQEYRTHACVENACDYRVTDDRIESIDCAACENTNPCVSVQCVDGACVVTNLPEGTPCGADGECDGQGTCSEGCEIGGVEYDDGELNPTNECLFCEVATSYIEWTDRPDGIPCGSQAPCFVSTCESGDCVTESIPPSTAPTSIEGTLSVCPGTEASLQAVGGEHGEDAEYEWGIGDCGVDPFAGANDAAIDTEALGSETTFWVRRVDPCSGITDCAFATVTMASTPAMPSVIAGPEAPCLSAGGLVYSVDDEPGVSLIWSVPEGWSITGGQGSSSITVTSGIAGGEISVTPRNDCGVGPARTLTVSTSTVPAQPGLISGSSSVCARVASPFSIQPVSGAGSYEWEYTGSALLTGTGTEITVAAQNDGLLRVRAENDCGGGEWRERALTVAEPSVGGSVSGGTSPVCVGVSPGRIALTGHTGSILNWQSSNDGGLSWRNISNTAGLERVDLPPLSEAGEFMFRALVRNSPCETVPSQPVTIVVTADTVGGSVDGNSDICIGDSTGTMTLSGHTGVVRRWHKGFGTEPIQTIHNLSTTHSETLSGAGLWRFRAVVQNSPCEEKSSAWHEVTVHPETVGGRVEGEETRVCRYSSTGIMTLMDHLGSVVRWERQVGQFSQWQAILAETETLTLTANQLGQVSYRAVVRSGPCNMRNSASWSIEVVESVGGAVTGGNSPVCTNEEPGTLTLTGHTGEVVKWQVREAGGEWEDIFDTAGQTSYEPFGSSVAGSYEYRAIVRNEPCEEGVGSNPRLIEVELCHG